MSDIRLREYQEEMCDYDARVNDMLRDGVWGIDVAQEGADETAVMIAYVDQGHTIREWFLLKDDQDAYIEFLESLLED